MSAEGIYKLEPHRTMQLRGFDRRGAEGAKIGLDITAVGSTFPGERLVVVVKL
jgi:hypothetical protein